MGSKIGIVEHLFMCLTRLVLVIGGLLAPSALAQGQGPLKTVIASPRSGHGAQALMGRLTPLAPSEAAPLDLVVARKNLILDFKRVSPEVDEEIAGPRTSGGGNSCSLVIQEATRNLLTFPGNPIPPYSDERLKAAIHRASFYVSEKPMLIKGEVKDAVNFPATGEIFISRRYCNQELIEVSGRVIALLLHEYLNLAGINDRKFQVSGPFLERYSAELGESAAMRRYVEQEAEKDLRGEVSCLKGALKRLQNELRDGYGERVGDGVTVNVAPAGFILIPKDAKYCQDRLDKNLKPTQVESRVVYRQCTKEDSSTFVATILFGFPTSSGQEEHGIFFQVTKKLETSLIVDKNAGYYAQKSEIREEKYTTTYECRELKASP